MNILKIPSRGKCRFYWTNGQYAEIAKNYESNPLFRELFIKDSRRLDLDSIYLTSLLHLAREEDILRAKHKIIQLKEFGILPYFLELNKFAIDIAHIAPNDAMSKSHDAIAAVSSFKKIDFFWQNNCSSKTISIDGNAPVDKHNGINIDRSEMVLRFNNFRIKGYEKYIGTKTDVWCHICDIRPSPTMFPLYDSIKINILTDNPLNVPVGNNFLNIACNLNKEFYYIPQETITELTKTLKAIPSSGTRLLMSLDKARAMHNIKCSIYGFSFINSKFNENKFDHYFEVKTESKERAHKITDEVNLLRNKFSTDKN